MIDIHLFPCQNRGVQIKVNTVPKPRGSIKYLVWLKLCANHVEQRNAL